MVDIIIYSVMILLWLLFTGVVNIVLYGLITLGVAPDWMVAGGLGLDLVLGIVGQTLVRLLIFSVREYKLLKLLEEGENEV